MTCREECKCDCVIGRFLMWLNLFGARHICFLVGCGLVAFLIIEVPQVNYVFWGLVCALWGTDRGGIIGLGVLLFLLLYNIVSLLAIVRWDIPPYYESSPKRTGDAGKWRRTKPIRTLFMKPLAMTLLWPKYLASRKRPAVKILMPAVLAIIGVSWIVVCSYDSGRTLHYPLYRLHLLNAAWMALVLAVWLASLPLWRRWHVKGIGVRLTGRLIGWLIVTFAVGELIWSSANGEFGRFRCDYLLYTQWAILEIIFAFLILTRIVDYWDHWSPWPIRLVGLVCFVLLALYASWPVAMSRSKEAASTAGLQPQEQQQVQRDRWIAQLKSRLDRMPKQPDGTYMAPVVLVAASGGGSRAAIFTSLVLEALDREQVGKLGHPSDCVLMISSVSGGSLGTANWLAQYAGKPSDAVSACSSQKGELMPLIRQTLDHCRIDMETKKRLIAEKNGPDPTNAQRRIADAAIEMIDKRLGDIQWATSELRSTDDGVSAESEYSWVLGNEATERMSMDFMAPLLRGVLTPGVNRGEALEWFWEERFRWDGIDNETELTAKTDSSDQKGLLAPLVLFNASKVTSGTRFIVGFPPLPTALDFRTVLEKENMAAPSMWTRNPPGSLSDLKASMRVSLAQAVRLSANFPWGLPVTKVENTHLLDGGVVDNTGLDSIYQVFEQLNLSEEGRMLLGRIAMRGVVLLEIDSGAKPDMRSDDDQEARGILEPLDGINNAAYTNADIAGERYREKIGAILLSARSGWIARAKDSTHSDEVRKRMDELAASLPPPLTHYPIQCERFQPDRSAWGEYSTFPSPDIGSVMTAWALPPEQRARVVSQFLIEMGAWKGRYAQLIGVLGKYAAAEQWFTNLLHREELERVGSLLAGAGDREKPTAKDVEDLADAIRDIESLNRSPSVDTPSEHRPVRELIQLMRKPPGVEAFYSAAPSIVAEPERLTTEVKRLKEELASAKTRTDAINAQIDDAIQKSPERNRELQNVQQAIDERASWNSQNSPARRSVGL